MRNCTKSENISRIKNDIKILREQKKIKSLEISAITCKIEDLEKDLVFEEN